MLMKARSSTEALVGVLIILCTDELKLNGFTAFKKKFPLHIGTYSKDRQTSIIDIFHTV